MKIKQIVITKVEEPVDTPQGEVFKVSLFNSKECVDTFHIGWEPDVLNCIKSYLEDLEAA